MKWLKSHAVFIYFVMVILIAFISVLIIAGPDGLPESVKEKNRLFPIVVSILLLSPIFSGTLLTGILDGKKGLKIYFKPLLEWRLPLKWYLSLFILPMVVTILLLLLSQWDSAYVPALFQDDNKLLLVVMGLCIGFFGGGLFEEFGWTGFALKRLLNKNSLLKSALIIGFVWGIWHLPVTYFASVDANGVFSVAMFLPTVVFYMLVLPVYRVLMVYAYHINKKLTFSMLMHTFLTATTVFVLLPEVIGIKLIIYYLILFMVLLMVVIFIKKHVDISGEAID